MIKLSNYGEYFIDCDDRFQVELIAVVVEAYHLGASQKHDEIEVVETESDYIRISATDRGKAIFEHLLNAIKNELDKHDIAERSEAIAAYKKQNNSSKVKF